MAIEPPEGEEDLARAWSQYLARGLSTHFPIAAAKARGATIETASGRSFLDFTTGIGVNNAGHLHPSVVAALREQLDRYLHLCFVTSLYEPAVALAKRLTQIAPVVERVAFFNSGAEAIENAVKVARAATKRTEIVAFEHAFHGRTLLAMTLTAKEKPYKEGFGPFAPGVHRAPFAYCYRCPLGLSYPECGVACAEELRPVLREADPAQTAAVLAEPVAGEGGFIVPPTEFFPRIKEICDEHDILFISDEIQAGLGRTGTWLAMDHYGVTPDLVTWAKALGGGLPLSAIGGRADLLDAPAPGSIGGTFGGNPMACVAGLAALGVIESRLPHASSFERRGLKRLSEIKEGHDIVGDVRGKGWMLAMEFVRDRETKEPAPEAAKAVQAACFDRGMLVLTAGTFDNVVRLLPPLTIEPGEFDRGLDILSDAVTAVDQEK